MDDNDFDAAPARSNTRTENDYWAKKMRNSLDKVRRSVRGTTADKVAAGKLFASIKERVQSGELGGSRSWIAWIANNLDEPYAAINALLKIAASDDPTGTIYQEAERKRNEVRRARERAKAEMDALELEAIASNALANREASKSAQAKRETREAKAALAQSKRDTIAARKSAAKSMDDAATATIEADALREQLEIASIPPEIEKSASTGAGLFDLYNALSQAETEIFDGLYLNALAERNKRLAAD